MCFNEFVTPRLYYLVTKRNVTGFLLSGHSSVTPQRVTSTGDIFYLTTDTEMASDTVSAQTRSRISGLDSASECESRIRRELISVSDLCGGVDEIQDLLDEITLFGEVSRRRNVPRVLRGHDGRVGGVGRRWTFPRPRLLQDGMTGVCVCVWGGGDFERALLEGAGHFRNSV